jgi:hypothetical protein
MQVLGRVSLPLLLVVPHWRMGPVGPQGKVGHIFQLERAEKSRNVYSYATMPRNPDQIIYIYM